MMVSPLAPRCRAQRSLKSSLDRRARPFLAGGASVTLARMAAPRAKKPVAKKKPSKKPAAKKAPPSLPKELATRAKAQHDAKLARVAERARAAVARIRERQVDVAANMVDIGLALAELKGEGMAESLGRTGFAEVCEKDLRMAVSTANGLIAIATKMPRELVTALGTDRAQAVLELVEATPEDDTAEEVLRAKLALPSGRTLDVAQASTRDIRDAARELRDANAASEKRSRGFSATPAEKKAFTALSKHLTASGHGGTKLVATRDGKGAKLRFEVRLTELDAFIAALRAARKG